VKLVAGLLVRNEINRYLEESVGHLLEFCDEVRVLDDGSTDGTSEWLTEVHDSRLKHRRRDTPGFYEHEGRTRNELLQWTLEGEPTHVLAIDADEFVADPGAVRSSCAMGGSVYTLDMQEVWELDGDCLCIREDGGWRSHPIPILWAVTRGAEAWRISDRPLACGRVPLEVQTRRRPPDSGTEILHFGWANEEERATRHARYVEHDQGRYHRNDHLDSIMWPSHQVELRGRGWPAALTERRDGISTRVKAPKP